MTKHLRMKMRTIAAIVITIGWLTGGANGALIISWIQSGNDVVAASSGSLAEPSVFTNQDVSSIFPAYVYSSGGYIGLTASLTDRWTGSDVGTFSASFAFSSFDSGLLVGLGSIAGGAIIDSGYVYGTDLTSSSTWASTTLSALNLSQDDYRQMTYNVAGGGTDTITLQVIPEPSLTFLLGVVGLGPVLRRRR